MTPGIEFTPGNIFRGRVRSDTRADLWHDVDLRKHRFNGSCDCEEFVGKIEDKLSFAKPAPEFRCKHLIKFEWYWMREVLPKL